MAGGKVHPNMLRLVQLVVTPPLHTGFGTGPDANQVDRAVTDVVVGVAEKIFGGEFPVTRDDPLVHTHQYLGSPFSAVATVQRQVQMRTSVAQVGHQIGGMRIPRRPHSALVGC